MREDYLYPPYDRESVISETAEELDELHDQVLASLHDEEKGQHPLEE